MDEQEKLDLLKDILICNGEDLYWKVLSGRRKAGPVGSLNGKGYKSFCLTYGGRRLHFSVHRVVWAMSYNEWPTILDHIDGDRVNNKLSNLRIVTSSQNSRNKLGSKNSSVPWKGVSYHIRRKCYESCIWVNNKNIYLGGYRDPKEAALAYNYSAEKHFGVFAKFNHVFEDVVEGV